MPSNFALWALGLGPWTQDSSHRLGPPGQLKAVEKILRHHGPMDPDSSDVAPAYQFTEQNFMRVNLGRPLKPLIFRFRKRVVITTGSPASSRNPPLDRASDSDCGASAKRDVI